MATSAPTEILRNELERLFDLDQMQRLSVDLLGLDPTEVGGTSGKAPFARALVERCAQTEMLEALADAITLQDRGAEIRLKVVYEGKQSDDLQPGQTVAGFKVSKKTHDEGFGSVFLATGPDGKQVTLKVLRDAKVRDRRGLQRFLTAQRALKAIDHPSVQKIVAVGTLPDGRPYLAAEHIDGQLLSARIGRAGAMHFNEARPMFDAIAEGLDKVHAAGIMHSDLRTEHVMLVRRDNQLSGVLIDFAVDRLAGSRAGELDTASLLVLIGSAKSLAPERARTGAAADVRSDVYAFGTLVYEVLTGKPAFTGQTPIDLIVAHVTQTPEAPSKVAPRGWVTREVDAVVLKAIAKDPAERFGSATEVVRALADALKGRRTGDITREEFETRKKAVFEAPTDEEKALQLESAGSQGIAWEDVHAALEEAATKTDDAAHIKSLLFRAARVAQLELKDLAKAKAAYEQIAVLDESDEITKAKLAEIRLALATPEEKADILLEEADKETLAEKRSDIFRQLGSLYEKQLSDPENALVAFGEALANVPTSEETARDIERICGDDATKWSETLKTLSEASSDKEPSQAAAIMVRAGRWYGEKLSRPDFAIACFTQALAKEPGNDAALDGAASIYRKAQQWPELVATLLKRADAQASPGRARDIRAEAADVLETKLSDARRARDLLEKILAEDPAQPRATQTLERIYIAADDWSALVTLLEKKADALSGPAKAEALSEIAETYEDRLKSDSKAATFFERAAEIDPKNLAALKGLERLYARLGQHDKMLRVLELQVGAAATPRQKVELWNRIGLLQEEEFVDHAKAAHAFEQTLAIDAANDTAMTGLARLYRVVARWDDLVALLERHSNVVEDTRRKADLIVARGRVLLDPIGSLERAGAAFEKALDLDPTNASALENAAKIRAQRGDAKSAAEALDALAAQAKTPAEKADAFCKAGRMLEEKGDRDGAIDRYKRALDADENCGQATARLRDLYAARGDAQGAIDMLQREIESADGVLARARLWGEVAKIYRDRVNDRDKAMEAAQKAVLLDATNEEASALLGEIKFDAGKFEEAAELLAGRAMRAKALGKDEGLRIALRYGEALAKAGHDAKALEAFNMAREIAPGDRVALLAVATATFNSQKFEQAKSLFSDLLLRFGRDLERNERAAALYRLGIASSKLGDGSAAVRALAEASDIDPNDSQVLDALADAYGQQGKWEEVAKIKRKRIDAAPDGDRYDLFIELGELFAGKVNDKTRAAKAYLSALELRPDDRRLLTRLMQLYSEERDWGRLVEIILRLADLVEDRAQLSKYYLTAAQLCHEQLNRPDEAIDYYQLTLENDPANGRALDGLTKLRSDRKDWAGLEQSYKKVLGRLPEGAPKTATAKLHMLLGDLYATHLASPAEAINSYERAQELDASTDIGDKLGALYLKDSKQHWEKAVRSQRAILAKNPQSAETYKALRKLFTEAKKADEAWRSPRLRPPSPRKKTSSRSSAPTVPPLPQRNSTTNSGRAKYSIRTKTPCSPRSSRASRRPCWRCAPRSVTSTA